MTDIAKLYDFLRNASKPVGRGFALGLAVVEGAGVSVAVALIFANLSIRPPIGKGTPYDPSLSSTTRATASGLSTTRATASDLSPLRRPWLGL